MATCVLALGGCQTVRRQPPSTHPAGTSTTTSPWQAARARGMAFRAAGQDPGWSVEVQKHRHPTLYVNLDDRGRKLEVANAQAFSQPKKGTVGFRGSAEDGTPVELTIHRGQCRKNMSSGKQAASARLDVGADSYRGCGRFLFSR